MLHLEMQPKRKHEETSCQEQTGLKWIKHTRLGLSNDGGYPSSQQARISSVEADGVVGVPRQSDDRTCKDLKDGKDT
jgi:hypothetical protein